MPKNTNKAKKPEKNFDLTTDVLTDKKINYFNKIQNLCFSTYCQNSTQTTKLKPNQTLFDRTNSNLTPYLSFYQKH